LVALKLLGNREGEYKTYIISKIFFGIAPLPGWMQGKWIAINRYEGEDRI